MSQAKINVTTHFIEIKMNVNDIESQLHLRELPYVHKMNNQGTRWRTSVRHLDKVLELYRGITEENIHTTPELIQRLYIQEQHRRIHTDILLSSGPRRDNEWRYVHQQLGVELAEWNNKYGFFYSTRTGKTLMSLQIMHEDIQRNPHHKWLVVCPLILIEEAWLEDAAKFFPHLKVVNLHDKTKDKRMAKYKVQGNVYVVNTEAFANNIEHIKKLGIHGAFLDESSSLKSHSSKFSNVLTEYAENLEQFYNLSGTPAPNNESEYYMQLRAIDPYMVHKSWTQFKTYFFNNESRSVMYDKLKLKQEKKDEFFALVDSMALYVDKEHVFELAGQEFNQVFIDMPDELQGYYNEYKEQLAVTLPNDATIKSKSVAAKINKLNQIASGILVDTENEQTYILSDYRIQELKKLLDMLGDQQVIIWANYRVEFIMIKELLGDKCGIVNGAVSYSDKRQAIKDFKTGKKQYLVANPASADKGLTLVNAHHAIYYSMNYSYELWFQSTERIYGSIDIQPEKCIYHILTANKSMNKAVYNTVTKKGEVSKAILDHIKSDALGG